MHLWDPGGWLREARAERFVEEPGRSSRCLNRGTDRRQPAWKAITRMGSGRKSERPIVVKKRSNVRGAKGLRFGNAEIEEGESLE